MDNQQRRSLEDRIMLLGRNAKFGDGHIWKHPTCRNAKVIYTSTTEELLEIKYQIAPEIFRTGVRYQDLRTAKGRYPNAKPMFRLASLVNPIFTSLKSVDKLALIPSLTLEDLALWYLDDGSTIARKDSNYGYTRSYLYIGNTCETEEATLLFRSKMESIFNTDNIGTIKRHTPFTSDSNKVWVIPVKIAECILEEASKYSVLKHKFPSWITFRDQSNGLVESKGKSTRSAGISKGKNLDI